VVQTLEYLGLLLAPLHLQFWDLLSKGSVRYQCESLSELPGELVVSNDEDADGEAELMRHKILCLLWKAVMSR